MHHVHAPLLAQRKMCVCAQHQIGMCSAAHVAGSASEQVCPVLDSVENLKWVQTSSAGVNQFEMVRCGGHNRRQTSYTGGTSCLEARGWLVCPAKKCSLLHIELDDCPSPAHMSRIRAE
eukprot:180222-Amphidinium_carterae.1